LVTDSGLGLDVALCSRLLRQSLAIGQRIFVSAWHLLKVELCGQATENIVLNHFGKGRTRLGPAKRPTSASRPVIAEW
jgi:hypothetical protein